MKTQQEWLQVALKLGVDNPDVGIRFCTMNDELAEDHGWTTQVISSVVLEKVWIQVNDERICTDEDEALDDIEFHLYDSGTYDDLPAGTLDKQVTDYFEEHVKKMICVYTQSC